MAVEPISNGHGRPSSSALHELLGEASAAYVHANPKSQANANLSALYFPGGSTRASLQMTPFTLTFASGSKATLTDVDGHVYADFLGEYTAGIFGHSNAQIRAAINAALESGWNLGGHSSYEAELAKRVCRRFQPTMERVRFTNSGTEANTFALATALAHFVDREPQRKRVMVFDGGYHGGTFKFPKYATRSSDPMNLPHDFIVAPFDNEPGVSALMESTDLCLSSTLAVMLIEPMQGNAGGRLAAPSFLRFLRAQCDRIGALLIFDEVQTSRLGPHGLGAKLGIQPDLMTLGKWVAGGMTFGAFGGRADLMEQFGRGGRLAHAGTFNNNVVSMAAGCSALEILSPAVLDAVNAKGDRLRAGLTKALTPLSASANHTPKFAYDHSATPSNAANGHASPAEWVKNPLHANDLITVTGLGSIMSFNFSGPDADVTRALLWHAMVEKGIYFSPRGFVSLSIEVTDEQIDAFIEAANDWVTWYSARTYREKAR